ncbi:hypothetical protein [Persephonella sp.]
MSKFKIIFLIPVLFILTSFQSYGYESRTSISVGTFVPNSEDLDGWEEGTNVTISLSKRVSQSFYLHFDLSGHSTQAEYYGAGITGKGEIQTKGIEVIGVFSHQNNKLELYAGIGLGIYMNTLSLIVTDGYYEYTYEDDGRGTGGVIKAGMRYAISPQAFIGGFIKFFGNNQEFRFYEVDSYGNVIKYEESFDFGGTVVNVEFGLTF